MKILFLHLSDLHIKSRAAISKMHIDKILDHDGFVFPVVWVDIKEPRSALRTGNFPGMLIKAFCRNLVFGHRYSCTRLCTTLTATPWI